MNQFFTFMVDWSLKSIVTVAIGLGCVLLLRNHSATTRHLIWRVTLVAIGLLPIAMALTPKQSTAAVMEPIQAPVRAVIVRLDSPNSLVAPAIQSRATTIENAANDGISLDQIVGAIYGLGLFCLVAFWSAGYLRIRRVAKNSTPATGFATPHRVLITTAPELRVPITFGLLKPVILLPGGSAEWPEQRVRAAILHESAHIARMDWAWQTASHFVRAVQWFNPAVWVVNRALHTTSEMATDDEVLMQFGMGASTYAEELLKVAEAARGQFRAAASMARPGGVATRLRRIVAKGVDRARPPRKFVVGLGLGFAVSGVLVAAGTVAEAEGKAEGAQLGAGAHIPTASSLISLAGIGATRGGTYETKLSHGGLVRMVALTGPQDGKGPMWRPDGTSASASERSLLRRLTDQNFSSELPKGRVINFYLQVSKLPMKPGETENGIFRIKSSGDWRYHMGSNTNEPDGRLQWDQWTAPATARSCDMDCAVSYGEYKEVQHGSVGDDEFKARFGDMTRDHVTVSFHIDCKPDEKQAKLECFDQDGTLISGGGEVWWGQSDGPSGQKFEFDYQTKDAKRIATYKFSTRDYEHVMIRGIQLPPTGTRP